jgi:carbohydrate esterase-like sialic acid-specific acetylesterase
VQQVEALSGFGFLHSAMNPTRSSNLPNLPFVFSQLSVKQTAVNNNGLTAVRQGQANVSQAIANTRMIVTYSFGTRTDNLHFDTPGQIALGTAMAEAYLDLARVPEPSNACLVLLAMATIAFRRSP